MKYVLGKKRLYWWPVTVALPDEKNPGKIAEETFDGRFELLERREYDAFTIRSSKEKDAEARIAIDDEFISKVMSDWREIVDENGADISFSKEALAQALQSNPVRSGLLRAILESSNGEEAKSKN